MSSVLYYSNLCENCTKLLGILSKTEFKRQIHFICIDKRVTEGSNTYVILENSKKILLPKLVTKLPALLILSDNNTFLYGDEILLHFYPIEKYSDSINNTPDDPVNFILDVNNSSYGVASDTYSYFDQSEKSMKAAVGDGGLRQMHNYVKFPTLNDNDGTPLMITRPEESESDRKELVGTTIKQLISSRENFDK